MAHTDYVNKLTALTAMADNRGPADSSLLERSDHSEDMISNSGTALDPREIEPLKDAVSQSAFPLQPQQWNPTLYL